MSDKGINFFRIFETTMLEARRIIKEKDKEIERLNNIIDEVREYVENNLYGDYGYECKQSKKELLDILNKEDKE